MHDNGHIQQTVISVHGVQYFIFFVIIKQKLCHPVKVLRRVHHFQSSLLILRPVKIIDIFQVQQLCHYLRNF